MHTIAVFGAGSWGTALAIVLAKKGHHVRLWVRRAEAAAQMIEERHNPSYFPGLEISPNVVITSDLHNCARGAGLWLMATPSQAVRSASVSLSDGATQDLRIVSAAKGIEIRTLPTPTHVDHPSLA